MRKTPPFLLVFYSKNGGMGRLFHIFFCSIDGGNEHNPNSGTRAVQFLVLTFRYVIRFIEQLQPIARFAGFFQRNSELRNKICFPVGILCLTNVGSNRGSASSDLI